MASLVSFIFILVLTTVFRCSIGNENARCTGGNFTTNSVYGKNRDDMLSRIYSKANSDENNCFYMGTTGQGPDAVYALGLCRPDSSPDDCSLNLRYLRNYTQNKCPNSVEAYTWAGAIDIPPCMLRYSNISFFGILKELPVDHGCDENNITSKNEQFYEAWSTLMNVLIEKAASGSSQLKFAAGALKTNVTLYRKIYAVLTCTPDLTKADCRKCLFIATDHFQTRCQGKRGGFVRMPSCFLRWDLYPFLKRSVYTYMEVSPQMLNSPPQANRGKGKQTIIISITSATALLIILLIGSYCAWKRKLKKDREEYHEAQLLELDESEYAANWSSDFPSWPLITVQRATEFFSDHNKLGEGGFGPVYKGTLEDGKEIAVKRLSRSSSQGLQEFKTEVTLIAKLQHRNLVRLLGCCLEKNEKLLIYEFMPNKSLDVFLFDAAMGAILGWERRLMIIHGVAKGLLYLHEDSRLRIIHRDLKVSNILLDDKLNPKISDFGMARIFGVNQIEANTNRVVGTYGYMAPEYAMEGLFSIKSDVFSFGVLLLEIIRGKKNNGFHLYEQGQSLLTYAWKLWLEDRGLELMDPLLASSYRQDEVLRCIHIGLLCVQAEPADRPTMSSVIAMLTSTTILSQPREPAFSVGREVMIAQTLSNTIPSSINETNMFGTHVEEAALLIDMHSLVPVLESMYNLNSR